jgi:hypothetical protein
MHSRHPFDRRITILYCAWRHLFPTVALHMQLKFCCQSGQQLTELELRQEPTIRAPPLCNVRARFAAVSSQWNAWFSNVSSSESVSIERDEVNVLFLVSVNSYPLRNGERNQGKMDSECRVFNRVWEEQYSLSDVGTITLCLCMHGCRS